MPDVPNIYVLTQPAEIAFCNLFEKRAVKDSAGRDTGREQWDMLVVMDPHGPDFVTLKKQAAAIFRAKFPGVDISDRRNLLPPWETGDGFIERVKAARGEKAPDNEHMRGKVLFKSHSIKFAPNLSVLIGDQIRDFRDEARLTVRDKFYPGCLVLAEFNLQPHKVGTNTPGVTAYLNRVCSLNKGERRGGGRSGQETFGAYLGHISAVDPTRGMAADDIPY